MKEGKLGDVKEDFFLNEIDHITNNGTSAKYNMRYLMDESYATGQTNPPILFYCGNEGDVWSFYDNSGFVTKNLSK